MMRIGFVGVSGICCTIAEDSTARVNANGPSQIKVQQREGGYLIFLTLVNLGF